MSVHTVYTQKADLTYRYIYETEKSQSYRKYTDEN